MDKFSKKISIALIIRGLSYLTAGIVAFFINIEQGGQAIPLISVLSMVCGAVILVATLGDKKKQQEWYFTVAWGVLELALGVYLSLFEPDFEFFVNLLSILAIMVALFSIVFSLSAKKKQNYLYLIAILNGAWGFAIIGFGEVLSPYLSALIIGFLLVDGLLCVYGGLLYQSVQEKLRRRKN
jgi:uncharacterized membrane protein HdeD (DUF308 family)